MTITEIVEREARYARCPECRSHKDMVCRACIRAACLTVAKAVVEECANISQACWPYEPTQRIRALLSPPEPAREGK